MQTLDKLYSTLLFTATLHIFIILGIGFILPSPVASKTVAGKGAVTLDKADDREPINSALLANRFNQGNAEKNELSKTKGKVGIGPLDLVTVNDNYTPSAVGISASTENKEILYQKKLDVTYYHSTKMNDVSKDMSNQTFSDYKFDLAKGNLSLSFSRLDQSRLKNSKIISSSTTYHPAASYMSVWVQRIENIGNANYPQLALKKNITGKLIVLVEIFKDGTVRKVQIMDSSEHQLLDQSALQTIRLASPFEPFNKALAETTDTLEIIRTFSFKGNALKTYELPIN